MTPKGDGQALRPGCGQAQAGQPPVVRVVRDALIIETPGQGEKHITVIPLEKLIKRRAK